MVRYFDSLRPPKLAERSFNNYRQYMNMFFAYCKGEDWIKRDPNRHVRALKVRERSKLYLSAGELLRMLEDAEPRDRALLAVGMNTLLRAQDLTPLKVGDVNLESMEITAWIEKYDRWDILPITSELYSELIRWFTHYAAETGVGGIADLPNDWILLPPMQYLAVNPWNPKQGGRRVYKTGSKFAHPETVMHTALDRMGHATKGNGIHVLRRSGARCLLNILAADPQFKGEPIRVVQAMLGHKNQITTEIYLGITHERRLRDETLRGRSFLGKAVQHDADLQARGFPEMPDRAKMNQLRGLDAVQARTAM